jgi:hypothetical protein
MTNAIVEKQKGIESLRKAVTKAKTKANDAKRNIKDYTYYLAQDASRTHLVDLIAKYEVELVKANAELAEATEKLAAAEATLPAVKASQYAVVLKWFSGSALAKAKDALELLDASVELGSWVPGASRKVYAALGKPNVASKTIKLNNSYDAPNAESALMYAVKYGSFGRMVRLSLQDATRELNDDALEFYIDFKPMVDMLAKLDATRPVPVFTTMNASPTVSAELKRHDAASVEVCPMEFNEVEAIDEKGNKYFKTVVKLVWPVGIKHNTSRYAYGTDNNNQCHACGHAIKNAFNWVPLILTTGKGEKKSLWVGRDCAKTLFGVDMTGDLEIIGGKQ